MRMSCYWQDGVTPFGGAEIGPVEGSFDVAVIGGGFTGLSAARRLARAGVQVALLEARHVGAGGSGRNGGHLNNGLSQDLRGAERHLGVERARGLYRAYDRSIEMIEETIAEEGIACDFRRAGKLKLASRPSHVAALQAGCAHLRETADPDARWLSAAELRAEIGSDAFHGAILYPKSAMMHMGRYVAGLAGAAARHGTTIWEGAPVTDRARDGAGWRLTTPRGSLSAGTVILATGAYTSAPFSWFRRRIIPVGSFLVTTRPLTGAEVAATMPGNRTCVTTMNIGHYFRLSPDNRLIFGGRARFSATSDAASDARAGAILRKSLAEIFPRLAGVEIEHCWGGLVGMTRDRLPRAGTADGVIYGMGYSGHGAQMSTLVGQALADIAMGRTGTNPLDGLDWPAVPFHAGKSWFMPLVGAWFGLKDRLS
jgi:glycine/D-amino acid oxidase-like deaminating enzyme